MLYVPAPTEDGSNEPPLTPGPEYVPPAGEPPLSAVGPSMSQNVSVASVIETVGPALTLTLTVDVFEHPFTSVPVTVYVVVEAGASVTGDPLSEPGIQPYVDAPLPVSITASPWQIVAFDAEAVTVGKLLTVTVTVAVAEHPGPLSPVTVYVVVDDGLTTTDDPLMLPGIHV